MIKYTIAELANHSELLKKYSKEDIGLYFESLIKTGDLSAIEKFLSLSFPPNKEVGVYLWNKKSNSYSYYENYVTLALENRSIKVFEYFKSKYNFSTRSIIDKLCAKDNMEMLDYLIKNYPPENLSERTDLLFSAMNDNFLEQFRFLSTQTVAKIDIYENNYELLKKACTDNKADFISVLLIDCNMQLNCEMRQWLNGDNFNESIYPIPEKIEKLRELNQRLQNLPPKEPFHCIFGKEKKKI